VSHTTAKPFTKFPGLPIRRYLPLTKPSSLEEEAAVAGRVVFECPKYGVSQRLIKAASLDDEQRSGYFVFGFHYCEDSNEVRARGKVCR